MERVRREATQSALECAMPGARDDRNEPVSMTAEETAVESIAPRLILNLLGSRVRIDSSCGALIEEIGCCFEVADSAGSSEVPPVDLMLHLGVSQRRARTGSPHARVTTEPAGALGDLTSRPGVHGAAAIARAVVQWALDRAAGYYTLHAAGVSRGGKGILLPGASHSGKSTLSVGLARRGFALLSDEVGVIELESGRIVSFPRAVSLRCDVLPVLGLEDAAGIGLERDARFLRTWEMGVNQGNSALPAFVVFPSFERRAGIRLKRLRPAMAAMMLIEASWCQFRMKVAGLDFVIDLAKRLPCYRLRYENVELAASAIEAIFEGREHDAFS